MVRDDGSGFYEERARERKSRYYSIWPRSPSPSPKANKTLPKEPRRRSSPPPPRQSPRHRLNDENEDGTSSDHKYKSRSRRSHSRSRSNGRESRKALSRVSSSRRSRSSSRHDQRNGKMRSQDRVDPSRSPLTQRRSISRSRSKKSQVNKRSRRSSSASDRRSSSPLQSKASREESSSRHRRNRRDRSSSSDSEASRGTSMKRKHHKTSRKDKKNSKTKKRRRKRRRRRSPSTSSSSSSSSTSSSSNEGEHEEKKKEVFEENGNQEISAQDAEEARRFKAAVQNRVNEVDEDIGPKPLPQVVETTGQSMNYGGALMPGEGQAIAQFVQKNMRIPRRGEVGWGGGEIENLETLGYVMSGSRHRRMNAIRIRKENQVYSAEEKRALALINFEEKQQRENQIMSDFRAMLTERLTKRHGADTVEDMETAPPLNVEPK